MKTIPFIILTWLIVFIWACTKKVDDPIIQPPQTNSQPGLHSDTVTFSFIGGSGTYNTEWAKFAAGSQVWHPFHGVHSGWSIKLPAQVWNCSTGAGICVEGYSFSVVSSPANVTPLTMYVAIGNDTIFNFTVPGTTGIVDVGVPFGKCY